MIKLLLTFKFMVSLKWQTGLTIENHELFKRDAPERCCENIPLHI